MPPAMSTGALRPTVLLFCCVMLAQVGVGAHAEILRSSPAADAVLSTGPSQVRIWFSEPIEATTDALVVLAPDGARVNHGSGGVPASDRTQLAVDVNATAHGTYSVRWKAVSADGHPIHGAFSFIVGSPSPASQPAAAADVEQSALPLLLQVTARWLHLIGVALVAGPLIGIALLGAARESTFDVRLSRVAVVGATCQLAASALSLWGQTTAIQSSAGAFEIAAAVSLLKTRWGSLWIARAILAVLQLAVAWSVRTARANARLRLVGGLLAAQLLATSLNGHSAATDPVPLSVAVDVAHLAATVAWAGGLVVLLLVVVRGRRWWPETHGATVQRLIPRFSTLAFICVETLVVTGLYSAWAHVDTPAALTSTPYGISLIVKVVLIVATMGPAAVNLLVVRPRLAAAVNPSDQSALTRRLASTVGLEVALVALILGFAAALTALPPARLEARRPAGSAAETREEPPILIASAVDMDFTTLSISPGQVGSNRIVVRPATDHDGMEQQLRIVPPSESAASSWVVRPTRQADALEATLSLAPEGEWQIQLIAAGGSVLSTFAVRIPAQRAAALLVKADAAMNALKTLVADSSTYENGVVTTTHEEYQAPNRMHRKTSDGEEVVVGDTTFMHHGTMWHRETQAVFQWPAFSIARTADEATVVGTAAIDGVECLEVAFVNASTRAVERIWIDARTWRATRRLSIAGGRTEMTRYSRFDAPLTITAPK